MALLPVTLYGDKMLRKKVKRVNEVDLKTIELIRDMFETMKNANGIGLAANQVGVDKSIFIVNVSIMEGYEDIKPLAVINPKIIESSKTKIFMEEGCLSIPNVKSEINRPDSIKIKFMDTEFNEQLMEADKLLARVMLHEYDHLQGILFTDLLQDDILKGLKPELNKIKNRTVEFDYPVSERLDYQLQ